MKKFTKGCLMTALVLFIIGVILSLVCGFLGGFRQLREMDGIGVLPLLYRLDDGEGLEFHLFNTFHRGEQVGRDWESEGYFQIAEEETVSLKADSFTELDIELAACSLFLERAADDQIQISVKGDTLRYYGAVEGSTLCIRNAGRWKGHTKDEVHIRIPAGQRFKELDVVFGEGILNAVPLEASEISMEIGAGVCDLQELVADEADLEIGAGQLHVEKLTTRAVDLDVGAGELLVDEISVSDEADLNMAMGEAVISGRITGDLFLECGMGTVTMNLEGSEDDHSYTVECSMGDVQVGSRSRSGFATEKSWNDGKESLFDIECNMGSVKITFEE